MWCIFDERWPETETRWLRDGWARYLSQRWSRNKTAAWLVVWFYPLTSQASHWDMIHPGLPQARSPIRILLVDCAVFSHCTACWYPLPSQGRPPHSLLSCHCIFAPAFPSPRAQFCRPGGHRAQSPASTTPNPHGRCPPGIWRACEPSHRGIARSASSPTAANHGPPPPHISRSHHGHRLSASPSGSLLPPRPQPVTPISGRPSFPPLMSTSAIRSCARSHSWPPWPGWIVVWTPGGTMAQRPGLLSSR